MTTRGSAQHETLGVESANHKNETPRLSSSPDLSTPPRSLSDPASPAQQLNREAQNAASASAAANPGVGEVKVRKKPGRKPKPVDPNAPPPEPKVRRPRKPKDPNAVPVPRKKKGASLDANAPAAVPQPILARQPKITEMALRPTEPASSAAPEPLHTAQNSKNEDIQRPGNSFFASAPPPPPPPHVQPQPQVQPQQQQQQPPPPAPPQVRSSGQAYDPIRSNYDPVRENITTQNTYPNSQQSSPKPSQMVNRASASPSISSLVDPPHQANTSPSLAAQSFFSHQQKMQNYDNRNTSSVPPSPTVLRLAPSPMMNNAPPPQPTFVNTFKVDKQPQQPQVQAQAEPIVRVSAPTPTTAAAPAQLPPTSGPTTISKAASSSAAPSPKPPKSVDITPPPLPGSGSGLLSNGIFGNGPKDGTDTRAPTIVLHIPMDGETNKYVNFTKLAEDRYGWEALHPRLAAQRERLARVAAAGAALEKSGSQKESGDEMSLDLSEGEGSNVEMGGMSDGKTGTDGGKQRKKRKFKEDEYDKEDDFIDDSEQLWEEQAAASKDGFFVYAGPLVQEVQKPAAESGPVKRGRGGGRGRGSTRGTTSTRGGGGPGSRGGTTTRKPRITKADRARMELEKAEREKMGPLAVKPSTYGGLSNLAATASMGGTPLIFNQ